MEFNNGDNGAYKNLPLYPTRNIIYFVKWSHETKSYYLEPYLDKFPLPNKIYGEISKIAYRVWNAFTIGKKSTGILLTGAAGGGKSLTISLISNLALQNNLAVVIVQKVNIDNNLIHWLSTLTNVVIYLDEFGKLISRSSQEQMLTMFSDVNGSKRIYLLTENKKNYVSEYILNRPGRIRYHVNFDKIDKATLEEYCKDSGVSNNFYKELEQKFKTAAVFTFDHLQCLVSEHLKYPEENLTTLLQYLNLDLFKEKEIYTVKKITSKDKPDLVLTYDETYGDPITYDLMCCRHDRCDSCVRVIGVKVGDKVEPLCDHIDGITNNNYYWWLSFENSSPIFNDDGTIDMENEHFKMTIGLKPHNVMYGYENVG